MLRATPSLSRDLDLLLRPPSCVDGTPPLLLSLAEEEEVPPPPLTPPDDDTPSLYRGAENTFMS